MGGSPSDVSEEPVTYEKRKKGWRMSCEVGKATEVLENELILQPFRRFTYVTAHSTMLPSLHLRNSSFSNPSVALPTSQLILQTFRRFTYITAHSPTLPSLYLFTAYSPTLPLLYLRHSYSPSLPSLYLLHSSFSIPSFASSTSQALHLRHLASHHG